MKAILLSICLLFGLNFHGSSQVERNDGLYFNKAGRQVWISDINGNETPRSLLIKVSKDSVFFLVTGAKTLQPQQQGLEIQRIHFSQINSLVTLRNSPGKQGAWIGGLVGIPIGLGLNAAADQTIEATPVFGQLFAEAYDQPSMVMGSILFGAGVGAGTGALIGKGTKKTWEVGGSKENFDKFLMELDKRAFWNRSSRP